MIVAIVAGMAVIGSANYRQPNSNPTNPPQTVDNTAQFLPKNICPDEMVGAENNNVQAKLGGKLYLLTGEDVDWINKNCQSKPSTSTASGLSSPNCTGKGSVPYTAELLRLNDLANIVPLGRMFDSHVTPTDHQYWQPLDRNASYNQYKLYAPADGHIVSLARTLPGRVTTIDQAATTTEIEYNMTIEHTCDFSTILLHVHSLPQSILDQVTFDSSNRAPSVRIKVTAGQEIGTVGGTTFDIITVDVTKKLSGFVNEKTYEGEPWKIYSQDTVAYYAEPLRTQYYSKISRTAQPVGGRIDYDKDGFAVGNWFRQGTVGYVNNYSERYWDGHLAIAYDPHVPSQIIFSTGHSFDGKSAQFMVDPNSPDPATVDASKGIVTYNLYSYYYTTSNGTSWNGAFAAKDLKMVKNGGLKGKVLLQVQPDKTLKVEMVPVGSSQTTFSGAAQIYTR